jgi:hypothetical protein
MSIPSNFGEFVYNTALTGLQGAAAAAEAGLRTGIILGETIADGLVTNDETLGQSQYDFRYRTFPEDLTNDYIGHYMVININVPVLAVDQNTQRTSYTAGQTLLPNELSKVDALRFGGAVTIPNSNPNPIFGSVPPEREPLAIPRFTRRIAESIAIFMPNPMIFNSQNDYQEISLTALGGQLATTVAGIGAIKNAVPSALGSVLNAAGQSAGQISRLAGFPINPRVEVMFSRTHLRQFVFEFLMAPRNEKESESMKAIIRTLRYHAAPELDPLTQGFTFIPPAEFDVTFYNKGVENTNIPRINTCVLDRVEVDYAPTGTYSTFTNGHPVAARLSLGMREVEIVHKRRVLQGF